MFAKSLIALLSTLALVTAVPNPVPPPAQQERRGVLPTSWHHPRDHPVAALFRRGPEDLPAVGSDAWRAKFANLGQNPEANIPQAWLDALHRAQAANLIPNIPLATSPDGGSTAVYPPGVNGGQEPICSSQFQCRHTDDIWDAPSGMIGLSVDDGPVSFPDASPRLYDFLRTHNQKVTHFMIGANILNAPTMFMRAFEELGDDIGVHTWTHRHMSLLSNEQLVAELGWTLQIIYDSTEGRVARYWRPPYGDCDNRVRAIAKHVFGLTTVIWNQDSRDWTMAANPPGTTLARIQSDFANWLSGPRTPGLVILEHEITADDVTAFINMYPLIAAASSSGQPWTAVSVAQLFDGHVEGATLNGTAVGWYQNAKDNEGDVDQEMDVAGGSPTTSSSAGHSNSTTSTRTGTGTATATSTSSHSTSDAHKTFTLGGVAVGVLVLITSALAL